MSTRSSITTARAASFWGLLLAAAAIMMLTTGSRQTLGLFLSPLNTATGLGIVGLSFALAVGQFVWGAAQPVFGAFADRYGPGRIIVLGGLMLAAGMAITPFMQGQWELVFSLGVLSAAGAGAGSFAILIGAAAQRLPAERRSFAGGFINAGGSFGQFVIAPLTQAWISAFGWVNAMLSVAALTLATLPLAWPLRRRVAPKPAAAAAQSASSAAGQTADAAPAAPAEVTLRQQLRIALRDRSYLLLHLGFFTCGVHVAFLTTHLPGEVALCGLSPQVAANAIAIIGLANIAGSLAAGVLGQRYRMKHLLFWFYAARAVLIVAYLAAPKTTTTMYLFAIGMGLTYLATVPPTAGIVGKLFGPRYLATLFGLTLLSHQTGGFLGAYLGGVAIASTGSLQWMWIADAVLALGAALVHLPIREAPVMRAQPAPAT
jgi:MFS family permease